MVLAELVESTEQAATEVVFALEHDPESAQLLRGLLTGGLERYSGRVVRDQLGLQLLLKRSKPDAVVMAVDTDEFRELAARLRAGNSLQGVPWIAITNEDGAEGTEGFDAVLHRPYGKEDIEKALDSLKRELCGATA
jgi:CheY-like chemotaxis protein